MTQLDRRSHIRSQSVAKDKDHQTQRQTAAFAADIVSENSTAKLWQIALLPPVQLPNMKKPGKTTRLLHSWWTRVVSALSESPE